MRRRLLLRICEHVKDGEQCKSNELGIRRGPFRLRTCGPRLSNKGFYDIDVRCNRVYTLFDFAIPALVYLTQVRYEVVGSKS